MRVPKQRSTKKIVAISVAVLLIILHCVGSYLYFNSSSNNDDTALPTIQETKDTSTGLYSEKDITETTSTTTAENSNKQPTKTPGKTPAQYEGESVGDEPAYNNEQFRIPEEE